MNWPQFEPDSLPNDIQCHRYRPENASEIGYRKNVRANLDTVARFQTRYIGKLGKVGRAIVFIYHAPYLKCFMTYVGCIHIFLAQFVEGNCINQVL